MHTHTQLDADLRNKVEEAERKRQARLNALALLNEEEAEQGAVEGDGTVAEGAAAEGMIAGGAAAQGAAAEGEGAANESAAVERTAVEGTAAEEVGEAAEMAPAANFAA